MYLGKKRQMEVINTVLSNWRRRSLNKSYGKVTASRSLSHGWLRRDNLVILIKLQHVLIDQVLHDVVGVLVLVVLGLGVVEFSLQFSDAVHAQIELRILGRRPLLAVMHLGFGAAPLTAYLEEMSSRSFRGYKSNDGQSLTCNLLEMWLVSSNACAMAGSMLMSRFLLLARSSLRSLTLP